MLQCSIPPLYCHDYDTNSVKWLHSVIKPTQSMEDERTPSPFPLHLTWYFSIECFPLFSLLLGNALNFFFFFNSKCTHSDKTFFGESLLGFSMKAVCVQKAYSTCSGVMGQGMLRLLQGNELVLQRAGVILRAVKALS